MAFAHWGAGVRNMMTTLGPCAPQYEGMPLYFRLEYTGAPGVGKRDNSVHASSTKVRRIIFYSNTAHAVPTLI